MEIREWEPAVRDTVTVNLYLSPTPHGEVLGKLIRQEETIIIMSPLTS